MPTLCIRRPVFDALTPQQRQVLQWVPEKMALGVGAPYADPHGNQWLLWQDSRFSPEDAALFACIITHLAEFPDFDPEGLGPVQMREECRRFCEAHGVVWPGSVAFTEAGNPWQETVAAQVPLQFDGGMPAGWMPMES